MQEGSVYWENRLLNECPRGAKCWHAIVPTILCAETPTHEQVTQSLREHPQGTLTAPAASRYAILLCALCKKSIAGSKDTLYALRMVIGVATPCNIRIKMFPARVCMQCVTQPAYGPGETQIQLMPSNGGTQMALNMRFSKIIGSMAWIGEPPSGYTVWQLLSRAFYEEHRDLLNEMDLTEEGKTFFSTRHIIPLPGSYPGNICKIHIFRDDWSE